MHGNRSMPASTIIPELPYPDVREAVEWLCQTFGFTERLRIGTHRAQLTFGNGSIVVTQGSAAASSCALMVRVDDVDSHHAQAAQAGAPIINPPTDYAYGERQYTTQDLGGHRWIFSQTIADVDPSTWVGLLLA